MRVTAAKRLCACDRRYSREHAKAARGRGSYRLLRSRQGRSDAMKRTCEGSASAGVRASSAGWRQEMKLIGAGLPRTGTLTQKVALEQLGLAPCYHWVNVIADLDQVELWDRALDGEAIWDRVFDGQQATVDWPGGYFYRELIDAYPDAKVLLSVREPESWERSFRETIWTMSYGTTLMPLLARARAEIDPRWKRYLELVDRMFWGPQGTFAAGNEPQQLIDQMLEHNAEGQRVVPAD